MSEKRRERAVIIRKEEIAPGIIDMRLRTEEIADFAGAGQFAALYCRDGSRLLPRPVSICEIDKKEHAIRLIFRVAGKGTAEFARLESGMRIEMLGPLGNGFRVEEKSALIVGGGIGIFPLLELAKQAGGKKQIVLGYRGMPFLHEAFQAYGEVTVATEDGSFGIKGNALDAIRQKNPAADVIYACGPLPMLRAVKAYAAEKGILCYVSLEERMACGIGACFGCVCKSRETDAHTNVKNKRICKEGPVFLAQEVDF